jgi:hypothetical protein
MSQFGQAGTGDSPEFPSRVARHAGCSLPPVMTEGLNMELARAEFEATWLEVRYQEGRASVADVERAIRRVDELRRMARAFAKARAAGGSFPWHGRTAVAPAGN